MQENEIFGKLVTINDFIPIRKQIKLDNKTLVWTNGCFDILHSGHVVYLKNARSYGDYMIVGLNSDKSFRQWKSDRPGPINTEKDRISVLVALRVVDFVILFDDSSPLNLIRKIQPDFYIKGDDYTVDTIDQNERKVIESYGGAIKFCSGIPKLSTSIIISKILDLYKEKSR